MQHPDEGTIHAWIDGELTAEESAALEAHLSECAECSALAAEARGLVAASSRIVSALDIVPGDVIPKAAPQRRPWYASTQLRAAAAVAIVAGASLLVMRDRGATNMARVMKEATPSQVQTAQAPAAELEADKGAAQSLSAPAAPAGPKGIASKVSEKKKPELKQEADQRKEAANEDATLRAPERILDEPVSAAVSVDSVARRRFNQTGLGEVVTTGVATASTAPEQLKVLRIDSAGKTTTFEASPGIEVTLVDAGPQMAKAMRAMPTAQSRERQAAAAAPPPAARDLSKAAQVNTISWTDRRGHQMTLTGPLSTQALEALRKRLPADQR